MTKLYNQVELANRYRKSRGKHRRRKMHHRPVRKCLNCDGTCESDSKMSENEPEMVQKDMTTRNSSAILKQKPWNPLNKPLPDLPPGHKYVIDPAGELNNKGEKRPPLILGPDGHLYNFSGASLTQQNRLGPRGGLIPGKPLSVTAQKALKEYEDLNAKNRANKMAEPDPDVGDVPKGKLWILRPGEDKPVLMDEKDYLKIPKNKGYRPYERPRADMPARPMGPMPPMVPQPMPGMNEQAKPAKAESDQEAYDRRARAQWSAFRAAPSKEKQFHQSSAGSPAEKAAYDAFQAAGVVGKYADQVSPAVMGTGMIGGMTAALGGALLGKKYLPHELGPGGTYTTTDYNEHEYKRNIGTGEVSGARIVATEKGGKKRVYPRFSSKTIER